MTANRDRLEQAALESVQRGGLKGLSFRVLAEEVGIKSSSVHYYFPEKSDLARALIERYSEEFFRELSDIQSKRWGLARKLKAFIAIFEKVATSGKLCLCGMMAAELSQLDDGNRQLLDNYFQEVELWLVNLFDDHRADLNTELSSGVLANSLLSGLEGALLLDRVVGNCQRIKSCKDLFSGFLS